MKSGTLETQNELWCNTFVGECFSLSVGNSFHFEDKRITNANIKFISLKLLASFFWRRTEVFEDLMRKLKKM